MLQVELKVVGGVQNGQTIRLKTGKFLIGREPDCQLRPKSELVSRHHCAFTSDDYTLRIRDLGSTNGTFVNDERIRGQVLLQTGDRVRVGGLEFEVLLRHAATPQPPAAEPQALPSAETASFSASETFVDFPATAPARIPGSPGGETTIINIPAADEPAGSSMQDILDQAFVVQPQFVAPPSPAPPQPQPEYAAVAPATGAAQQSDAAAPRRASGSIISPPIKLPDPSTTGLKQSAAKPAAEQAADHTPEVNPSDRAAEIIRQFRHRRPTS
ncbi:MAG: FHA domain-containing protein [Planctomycetales bacterium]